MVLAKQSFCCRKPIFMNSEDDKGSDKSVLDGALFCKKKEDISIDKEIQEFFGNIVKNGINKVVRVPTLFCTEPVKLENATKVLCKSGYNIRIMLSGSQRGTADVAVYQNVRFMIISDIELEKEGRIFYLWKRPRNQAGLGWDSCLQHMSYSSIEECIEHDNKHPDEDTIIFNGNWCTLF